MHAGVLHTMQSSQQDVKKSIPCMELIQGLNIFLNVRKMTYLTFTYKYVQVSKVGYGKSTNLLLMIFLNYQMGGVIVL